MAASDEIVRAYHELAAWCRERDYAGHDPFDALNSRLFQATPFVRRSRAARILWTQLFKRSPVNLRRAALVPAGRNPKGTALFTLAALARWRTTHSDEDEREARTLLDSLLADRIQTASGATAWGYNFDWQSRAFFAPRGTPTVVPTAFAARALVEAARDFSDDTYLRVARRVCDFILRDLVRTVETSDEVCFSYTPLDRSRIFNASLLAAETLAEVGARTGEQELCAWALRAARYVVRRQRGDGSWAYGEQGFQGWTDNFHTAFILSSLWRISSACGVGVGAELTEAAQRGFEFWRGRFFLADGFPKYYHDEPYPADAHSAAAAIVTLVEKSARVDDALPERRAALALAEQVASWTLDNLRDRRRGFFYYQRRRFYAVRTPYIRWAQAWMLYALARLIEGMKDEG
ncbi:MAG TPA: hypothetical protein VGV59_10280 [Pyrinomonadaceae bacterium]|nr:hypothetical protein [Pyrinomonadaceae bacterium]